MIDNLRTRWTGAAGLAGVLLKIPTVYKNWPYFLASRFTKKPGVLRLRNGLRFQIRPQTSDRSSITEIFTQEPYTRRADFRLQPTDIVVDIGANIGAFTVYAASVATRGRVYAAEPMPDAFQGLKLNVALNNLTNVTLSQVALDALPGKRTLFGDGIRASMHFDGGGSAGVAVDATTLDAFLATHQIAHVDYLKIDCEGAEFDIVATTPDHVMRRIRKIGVEYHNRSDTKNASTLLRDLHQKGFRSETVADNDWQGLIFATNLNFIPH